MLTVDPHTLDDVLDSVVAVGRATGHEGDALTLVASLRDRLDAVRSGSPDANVRGWSCSSGPTRRTRRATGSRRWSTAAGGEPVLGAAGEKSVRVTWDAVHAARPDVVVVAPCGFDRAGAQQQADDLVAAGRLPGGVVVHAVDADGLWARPGPRLVDGVEELAALLHP